MYMIQVYRGFAIIQAPVILQRQAHPGSELLYEGEGRNAGWSLLLVMTALLM